MKSQVSIDEPQMKVVLIGDPDVGKTSIFNRFVYNTFSFENNITIDIACFTKKIEIGKEIVRVCLWDTCGHEKFRSIAKSHLKGLTGIIIVYDVTTISSFVSIESWIKYLNEECNLKNCTVMLVGNKNDMAYLRQVDYEDGMELSKKHNAYFHEISALWGAGFQEVFHDLVAKSYPRWITRVQRSATRGSFKLNNTEIKSFYENQDKSGCCQQGLINGNSSQDYFILNSFDNQ